MLLRLYHRACCIIAFMNDLNLFLRDVPSSLLNFAHFSHILLTMFVDNQVFCKIPLTVDLLQLNPFRYCTDFIPEPGFLVHAVMALAGHHVESTSTYHHCYTAIKFLRECLGANCIAGRGPSILDAIITLFSFDVSLVTLHVLYANSRPSLTY